jgi:4'-phosphopantetheinyl transferase
VNKLDDECRGSVLPTVSASIDPGEIDLWFVRLRSSTQAIDTAAGTLSIAEMQRAGQFRFSLHRERFILAHAALRGILSTYSGCPASSLEFARSPHGKPALANTGKGQIEFNLSHSDDLAVVAVSPWSIIGVDVEQVREMTDWPQMARQFYSDAEIASATAKRPVA